MATFLKLAFSALLASSASAKIYFQEEFNDGWESRWVKANTKGASQGAWKLTHGEWFGDAEADKGLQTAEDYRFYHISAKLGEEFSNRDKDLVLQYSVKHEQKLDCGGGYIKLLPAGLNQPKFNGDSEYNIMFGPDICGTSTRKTHVIFHYKRDWKDDNLLIKKEVRTETDQLTHVYTLIVHPDNTYEVLIDGKSASKGSLAENWDFLPSKEIKDPKAKKPADWVDEEFIADPEDKKPSDWDDVPREIDDPDAKKPDDWDDDEDGEWEAPLIPNPEFRGEWKARMIPNPEYKGKWEHPMIPNPDYKEDSELYLYDSNAYVGFDLWQVKAGSIFDNILVTDSIEEAAEFREATWAKNKDAEKKAFDKFEEEKRKQEEAARKTADADDEDDEYDDDGEDDDDDKDEL
eukprot:TRINITY_DN1619_c0_g1::TRINITY_DN1619_c0_g1_i1::g.17908::m.17908 TRINITY_DN1619_c0_g1::TRINITY_DN1619_c0_g1_i1::g.17908  ORF type:complete len:419 (+),score=193.24,sp/Q23858/CALR_DICDI/55.84/2e-146,Calreticulin/PF00262.13/8.5e-119,Calreticulin/PF00262.13/1.5e+04 TRINITY_DN1619_c0_g1_i1:44-1258(+)